MDMKIFSEERKRKLKEIKVGDTVTRIFAGLEQQMKVSKIEDNGLITCGLGWQFHPETGCEVDMELGAGYDGVTNTISYLKL